MALFLRLAFLAEAVVGLRFPMRMSASGPQRIKVCGTSTLHSVVAAEIESRDGWISSSGDCDAAVICGSDGSSANALARELSSGQVPSRVVVTLPRADALVVENDGSEAMSALSSFFSKDGGKDEAFDPAALSGASFVTILRYGELFGADGTPPLVDGLKKNPKLSEDVIRRGVRLGPGRRQTSSKLPAARRGALAKLALELLEYSAERSQENALVVELECSSLAGPEPNDWSAVIDEALKASETRTALRLKLDNTATGLDQKKVQDWIIEQWGPAALRANAASYATTGARPVAFEKSDQASALRYEDFDGSQVMTAGRLTFTYDTDSTVLMVTRSSDDPLPGEQTLLDNFADAFTLAFSVEEEDEEEKETLTPVESTPLVVNDVADKEETAPEEVKKTPMRKRRSAVRARTSTSSSTTPAAAVASKGDEDPESSSTTPSPVTAAEAESKAEKDASP